jgi:spore coat polysaccharide biosynthesis predicted glycosyltransferase SpsG
MKVLFRLDASKKIGYGHLFRSIAIAKFLKKRKVLFLINDHENTAKKILKRNKLNFKTINTPQIKRFEQIQKKNHQIIDAQKTLKIANDENIKFIVLDDYHKDHIWHKEIIKKKIKLCVIDDLCNKEFHCSLYINFNNTISQINKKKINNDCKILCGHQYNPFLLKNFNRTFSKKNNRIHLCISSSINKNFLNKILKALNSISNKKKKLIINVFCVNYDFSKLNKNVYKNLKLKFYVNSNNYFKNIKSSDLGIGFSGMSMFDRISYLLPSINFSNSKNQTISLNDKFINNFFYSAKVNNYSYRQIKLKLQYFLSNIKIRENIYKNCKKLKKKNNILLKNKILKFFNEFKSTRHS